MVVVVIDSLLHLLAGSRLGSSDSPLEGAGKSEISAAEQQLGVQFPADYRSFLEMAGLRAGRFMLGTTMSIRKLADMQACLKELAHEEAVALPARVLVFAMHQGYQFLFMPLDEGTNPPVYRYTEGGEVLQVAQDFASWLAQAIDEEIALDHR